MATSIERLIWKVRRERGETSEQKVASALSFLFEEGVEDLALRILGMIQDFEERMHQR